LSFEMSPYLRSLVGPGGTSSAVFAGAFAGAAVSQSATAALSRKTAFLRWDVGFIGTLLKIGFDLAHPASSMDVPVAKKFPSAPDS